MYYFQELANVPPSSWFEKEPSVLVFFKKIDGGFGLILETNSFDF
jgi:hypothetical protein